MVEVVSGGTLGAAHGPRSGAPQLEQKRLAAALVMTAPVANRQAEPSTRG